MAHRLCFSSWLLVCWALATVAEGQIKVVVPPRDSRNNVDTTDCQIFTLTPPPPPRNPVTTIQPFTRTPKCPFFPTWRPRVHIRFPNRPFLPPRCNQRFHFHPIFWPNRRFPPHQYFPRRRLRRGSSSEENRKRRDAPNLLTQRKSVSQKRL